MKKYFILFIGLIGGISAHSQEGEMDALRYSQNQLSGTAHYMGMAGAFNALGGDISSISQNPAGIAVYRKSELAMTLDLNYTNVNATQNGTKTGESLTKFTFDNIGYVGTAKMKESGTGIMNWNFGFVYNRLKSFDRNYTSKGNINKDVYSSLTSYIAETTYGIPEADLIYEKGSYDPYYDSDIPYLSILGYEGYLIQPKSPGGSEYESDFLGSGNVKNSELNVSERGHIDEYDFSFGFNYSNMLYFGATLGITDIDYDYSSYYQENFDSGDKYALESGLSTSGTGFNVKLGAIFVPTYSWRIGLAYHTPTYYNMTDYYYGYVNNFGAPGTENAETPYDLGTDYEIQTPQKLLLGTAFLIEKGVLSIDYEYCDYSTMKLKNSGGSSAAYSPDNDNIKNHMVGTHTIKVGAEYRITNDFSLRAGYAHITSPLSSEVKDGKTEIYTGGTIPSYTVNKGTNYYTCGLGYRYNNFFVDLAYVMNSRNDDLYAFSPVFYSDTKEKFVFPSVSSLKTNRSSVLLSLGVRF